jgi:two-component SAPR family response regulator
MSHKPFIKCGLEKTIVSMGGKIAKVTPEEFDKIVKCLGPLIGLGGPNDSIRFLLQDSF